MTDFELSDELAVRAVLARYCHRCDDGDFAGVASLFAPEGAFVYGDLVARGRNALLEFLGKTQGRPEQRGKHLTVNCVVERDGDRARAVSDFLFLRHDGSELVPAITGRYHDELVRLDDRWLISRRDVRAIGP